VNREQRFICLNFDHYAFLHQEIDPVASLKQGTSITKRRTYLPLKMDLPLVHFIAKTPFVGRFQKPRPEMPMNLDTGPNDPLCNLVLHSARPLRLSVEKTTP
jgi:hypothetical protein